MKNIFSVVTLAGAYTYDTTTKKWWPGRGYSQSSSHVKLPNIEGALVGNLNVQYDTIMLTQGDREWSRD